MSRIELPHSGLTVPVPHPLVTDLKTLDLSTGQAFRAEVWMAGGHMGWFENSGTGGETTFQPSESGGAALCRQMDVFVASCTHSRHPVPASTVFTLLVEEHDHTQLVRDACHDGGTAARFLVGGMPIGVFAEVGLPPERWADLALESLRALEPIGTPAGVWQVWDGGRWREVAAAPGDAGRDIMLGRELVGTRR